MTMKPLVCFIVYLWFQGAIAKVLQLSDVQKQEVVDTHNDWRIRAGATAMLKMKWNDGLAKLAETIADKCKFEHSSYNERSNVAGFSYVGENIYVGSHKPTVKSVVDRWGDEVKDYDIQSNQCRGMCGHYTQVAWSKTSDVGCAMAQCNNVQGFGSGYLVFCHYGPGGNIMGQRPYEIGPVGSKCQQVFKMEKDNDGLCVRPGETPPAPQTTPKPTTQAPSGGSVACEDKFSNCPYWERQCGQFSWMLAYCRKTCKVC